MWGAERVLSVGCCRLPATLSSKLEALYKSVHELLAPGDMVLDIGMLVTVFGRVFSGPNITKIDSEVQCSQLRGISEPALQMNLAAWIAFSTQLRKEQGESTAECCK